MSGFLVNSFRFGGPFICPENLISLTSLGAYYKFDGNPNDDSGNGLNGTNNGSPTYTSGKFGDALTLNGTSQYVSVANNALLNGSGGNISVFAWVKITDFASDATQHVVAKWLSPSTGWRLVARAGDILITIGSTNIGRGSGVPTGEWVHIGFTKNGTVTKTYQNGVQVGSDGSSSGTISSTQPMHIGRRSDASNGYTKGQIDDVSVWQRVLTPSEVSALYNSTCPLKS